MKNFSITPKAMIASLWNNYDLLIALIKREVVSRYRGSFLGILWSFFNPVFMLTVYTFVFSFVFKARWGGSGDSKSEFALLLFAGMIVFSLFSECVNRAPSLIIGNVNYVKKVVFPLEVLPMVLIGSAGFHLLISFTVWFIFYIVFFGIPHLTVLWLPFVIFPLVLFVVGISWILSALGVYLRDVGQIVGVLTSALLFLSPIFYPVSALPEKFQIFLKINPLTLIIEQCRKVIYWGDSPDFYFLGISFLGGFLMAWLGFVFFQKTRKGFADVL